MPLRNLTTKKIVGLGEVLWDIYGDEKYLGGAPVNFALHAAQLGNEGIIVSRLGEDQPGEEILKVLQNRGITIRYIQRDPIKKTGTVYVHLDQKGVPNFDCSTDVAFDYLDFGEDLAALAKESAAVLFGTLAQRNLKARATTQAFVKTSKNALKVYDINLRAWGKRSSGIVRHSLKAADMLKLNEDELTTLKTHLESKGLSDVAFMSKLMSEFNLKMICLTLGEEGCFLITDQERIYSPGVTIKPIDTTGSGDAFVATFVTKYLEGASWGEIAEFSNYVGAYVATQKGAVPHYDRQQIEAFFQTHQDRNLSEKFRDYLFMN